MTTIKIMTSYNSFHIKIKCGQRVTYMQAFKIEGHQTLLMKQSEKKVGTDNDCKNDINSMILK